MTSGARDRPAEAEPSEACVAAFIKHPGWGGDGRDAHLGAPWHSACTHFATHADSRARHVPDGGLRARKPCNMTNRPCTSLVLRTTLALAAVLAIAPPELVQAAERPEPKGMTSGIMMEHCQKMMAQKQQMMDEMAAQDVHLTEQLAKMSAAPPSENVDLIASVVTHLVEERVAMDAKMAAMDEEMMKHVMGALADGQGVHGPGPHDDGHEGDGRQGAGCPRGASRREQVIQA